MLHYLQISGWFLVGTVFLVAVGRKLSSATALSSFVGSVRELRIVPRPLAGPVAAVVVGAETAVPAALAAVWLGLDPVAGLGLAVLLLSGFTTAIVLAMRQGSSAPCACFGASALPLGRRHVVRNLLLAAVALAGILCGRSAGAAPSLDVGLATIAAAGGAIGAIPFIVFDELVDLFRPGPWAQD